MAMEFLAGAVGGALTGLAYSVLGFVAQNKDGFDPSKFGSTILIGAAVGALYGSQGVAFSEDAVSAWTAMGLNFGTIYALKKAFKGIVNWKKLVKL